MLRQVLELAGLGAITASNGVDAIAKATVSQPNLIMLDLMMPVMDGWEFLKRRAESVELSAIPVIVMTAYRFADDTTREHNVRALLAKPFDIDDVLGLVDEVLGGQSASSAGSTAA
jgi:CheY-like chemotaxis protein